MEGAMATRRALLGAMTVACALALQGCTMGLAGLTLLGAAVSTVAEVGTSYTFDGDARRTITAPLEDVRRATQAALERMEIPVASDKGTGQERQIRGRAGNRSIGVTLFRITANLTRLQVTATHHLFVYDRSTAVEVVTQVENALNGGSALPRKALGGGLP
jgi:uncharacterized protein DUF3568